MHFLLLSLHRLNCFRPPLELWWVIISMLYCVQAKPNHIQLFQERLLEKVYATILKGIVDGFEFSVLQRNLKEWHERPWTYVCECERKATKVGSTAIVSEQCVDNIPYYLLDCRVHIFFDNLSWNSCILIINGVSNHGCQIPLCMEQTYCLFFVDTPIQCKGADCCTYSWVWISLVSHKSPSILLTQMRLYLKTRK